jgi:hypothetical protein
MSADQAMAPAGAQLAAETLAAVLGQENAALARMDFRAAGALGPAKAAAVAGFVAAATGPEGLRREDGLRLSALAGENRALLERAMAAQRAVLAAVVAVGRRGGDAGRYTASGTRAGERRALAVSERV